MQTDGRAAPPRRAGPPPRSTRPGPHPAPPRAPGPPRHRGRRPILLAAALTLVLLLGYGGYTAWNALTGGGGSGGGDAPAAESYEGIVNANIFIAGEVVGQGVDVRLMGDLNAFRDTADRAIFLVGTGRSSLAALTEDATGPQRDVIASTQQSLDALQAGLIQWRDAVYNLRLASVDDAHAAIDSAVARLRADLERWQTVSTTS